VLEPFLLLAGRDQRRRGLECSVEGQRTAQGLIENASPK
jgi:hypothetical protein